MVHSVRNGRALCAFGSLLVYALATLAGCSAGDTDTGQTLYGAAFTRGQERNAEFSFTQSTGCRWLSSCNLSRPLQLGADELIVVNIVDPAKSDPIATTVHTTDGTSMRVPSLRFTSADPSVLQVLDVSAADEPDLDAYSVRVHATGVGSTELAVTDAEGKIVDRVQVRVQAAARLVLTHDTVAMPSGTASVELDVPSSIEAASYSASGEHLLAGGAMTWSLDDERVVARDTSTAALVFVVFGTAGRGEYVLMHGAELGATTTVHCRANDVEATATLEVVPATSHPTTGEPAPH